MLTDILIIIHFMQFITMFLLIVYIGNKFSAKKVISNRIISKIEKNIIQLKSEKLSKIITPLNIVILSIFCFILAFIPVYCFFGLFLSSFIICIPFAFAPYIVLKIENNQEKDKIKKLLPMYTINLKGYISNENNIILAIKKTKVEAPLSIYISRFVVNVDRGMNILEAFNILKRDVNIPEFTELISAFQVCYINGGKFVKVLEVFSRQMSNILMTEEKEKEKNLSSIVTLCVMLGLNVFLVVSYVFGNVEFANIIRENTSGHIIMDINAISCVLCIYFLFKMYKLEE